MRNQEILWRALGGAQPKPTPSTTVESLTRIITNLDACTSQRTHRQLERDLVRARIREARNGKG